MKFLKYTAIFLGILVLLAVVTVICLTMFVNPNRFKPMLERQAAGFTGRTVTIDGDLSWTIFPTFGVKVGHMVMSNPAGFTQPIFAEISGATLSVNVMPLFHGQIESKGIVLKGMSLHLIKNVQGSVNWNLQPSTPVTAQTEVKPEGGSASAAPLGLMISDIEVSDSNIIYLDETTHQTYSVKNVNVKAKDISTYKTFPFTMAFDFAADKQASGHVNFDSNVSLDVIKQIYKLEHIDLTADINADTKKIKLKLTGDMKADLNQQRIDWQPFEAHIANMVLAGQMQVTQLSKIPAMSGQMTIKPFNLKDFLHEINQPADALEVAEKVAGKVDFFAQGDQQTAKGVLTIDTLQTAKIRMSQVNAAWHLQNRVIYLDSLKSDLYQGHLNSQGKVDLTKAIPFISANATLSNVQAEPLVNDLSNGPQTLKIKGTANANVNITTAGLEKNTLMQNLNGTAKFSFANGMVEGVDIGYLINNASSLVHKQTLSDAENTNQTNFGSLQASAIIQHGVATTNDLLLDSVKFQTQGKGTVNLINQGIDLSLLTTAKNQDLPGIPVTIKGTLASPSVRLDTSALLNAVAKEQVKEVKSKVQDKIQEKIQERLPGEAGQLFKNLLGH